MMTIGHSNDNSDNNTNDNDPIAAMERPTVRQLVSLLRADAVSRGCGELSALCDEALRAEPSAQSIAVLCGLAEVRLYTEYLVLGRMQQVVKAIDF